MDAATLNTDVDTLLDCPHQPHHQNSDEDILLQHRLVVPKICITEGESDSDDTEEHSEATCTSVCEASCVKQDIDHAIHESVVEKDSEESASQQYRRPFMVYKGHRNARTMVSCC